MSQRTETAILAGGCFWPAQELLRHRDGVISITDADASGIWSSKVVTKISQAGPFWEAEDQAYLQHYPAARTSSSRSRPRESGYRARRRT